MFGIAWFASWQAYSKIISSLNFSGIIAVHGFVHIVGSLTVNS
jgi:hypothetical protein